MDNNQVIMIVERTNTLDKFMGYVFPNCSRAVIARLTDCDSLHLLWKLTHKLRLDAKHFAAELMHKTLATSVLIRVEKRTKPFIVHSQWTRVVCLNTRLCF